ncbi:MAG: hypothetical protein EBR01_12140 [Proteobacteria bacterium]|nr:hypothetical protein [Pseudomonadota bacterium]
MNPVKRGKSKNNTKLKQTQPPKTKDRGVQLKSHELSGKKIAMAICGGIASVESVKIIRELRRHDASVFPFYTPEVLKFMTELPVEWASGNKVILDARAQVDHLEEFDLVIVVPATLNTISKAALGIADNVVTLLIAGQLGKRGEVLIVPTMNAVLKNHPLFESYRNLLESWGVEFLSSEEEEDRLKVPSPEVIAGRVIAILERVY